VSKVLTKDRNFNINAPVETPLDLPCHNCGARPRFKCMLSNSNDTDNYHIRRRELFRLVKGYQKMKQEIFERAEGV
jgi:hypothetical protein